MTAMYVPAFTCDGYLANSSADAKATREEVIAILLQELADDVREGDNDDEAEAVLADARKTFETDDCFEWSVSEYAIFTVRVQ
jgi:hypothetical protein